MSNWLKSTALAAAAGAVLLVSTAPEAEAQWRRHRGGAVAAGVAAGLIGGAVIGSLAARPYYYGHPHYYYDEPYAYAPAYYPAYRRVYRPRRVVYRAGYGGPRYVYGPGYGHWGARYAYGPGYGYWGGPRWGWGGPGISVGFGW